MSRLTVERPARHASTAVVLVLLAAVLALALTLLYLAPPAEAPSRAIAAQAPTSTATAISAFTPLPTSTPTATPVPPTPTPTPTRVSEVSGLTSEDAGSPLLPFGPPVPPQEIAKLGSADQTLEQVLALVSLAAIIALTGIKLKRRRRRHSEEFKL